VGKTKVRTSRSFYVDLLLEEWNIAASSGRLHRCMCRVLKELDIPAQMILRREPKLQVVVHPKAPYSIWAYFPVHRARIIVPEQTSSARVILLIDSSQVESSR
jgi:hypothetical protein